MGLATQIAVCFFSFLFHQCLIFQQVPQHSKPFSHICSAAAARKKGRKEGRIFMCKRGKRAYMEERWIGT